MAGIYKITNTINGKVYIGESMDIERRWEEHREDLRNGTHHSRKLQDDYNTYEINNLKFELLKEINYENLKPVVEKCLLIIYEDKYIKKYDSINKGYNTEETLQLILNGERPIFNDGRSINKRESYILKSILKNMKENNGVYIPQNTIKKFKKDKISCENKESKSKPKSKQITVEDIYAKENINIIVNKYKKYKFNEKFMSFAIVLRENGFNVTTVYQILRDINIIDTNAEGNKIIIDNPSMFYNKEYISYDIDTGEINSIRYSPCISREGFKFLLRKILEHSKNNNIIPFTKKYIKENLLVD